jgi:hypothetical protein
MALIDEGKLQGNIGSILEILRKQAACCAKVASTTFAKSSVTSDKVFVLIFEDGTLEVRDIGPNGAVLTPAGYGFLTMI